MYYESIELFIILFTLTHFYTHASLIISCPKLAPGTFFLMLYFALLIQHKKSPGPLINKVPKAFNNTLCRVPRLTRVELYD